MKKITTIFLLFTFYFLLFTFPAVAIEDIGYSRLHPAHPLYFLKTVRENLELKFAQTEQVKNLRQLEFATRRLREIKALINLNEDLIPPTMERYMAHLNNLSDKRQDNDKFAPILQHNLSIHLQTLENIYDQTASTRARLFIRSAMNRLIQRADLPNDAEAPICNLFLREASSSALNQTEQLVLQDRSDKCFQTSKIN